MEKGKVIDLVTYRNDKAVDEVPNSLMSEELKNAIQLLIRRLKEEGPISQPA